MKRPSCRSSAVASQGTTDQQEDSCMYMERQGAEVPLPECDVAYDEEDEDELAGGGGRGGLGEKKLRLAAEQVRALERSFEADNKLDPERKARIARDLRLHPRQVAVWFQNRRARWKTKQIERDFAALRARHDALRRECDDLRRDKDTLAAEVRELRDKLLPKAAAAAAVKMEAEERRPPGSSAAPAAAAAAVYKQDGSTDSDSSAVFNEEASPYSGSGAAALDHHQRHHLHPAGFTGFTSFLASSSALSSSFLPSMYHGGSHLDQEDADGLLGGAAAADSFFAEEQGAGLGSWYGGEGW